MVKTSTADGIELAQGMKKIILKFVEDNWLDFLEHLAIELEK